jgi:hypothetical protein
MADSPVHRYADPDAAHIRGADAQGSRLGENCVIRCDAVGDQVLAPDPVAGIRDPRKLLDRRLLDLANNSGERDIATQLDARSDDGFNGNQRGGKAALHIMGAEAPHPAITIDGSRFEPGANQIILIAIV